MWVQSLGWENPPEKGMVTHSSILAWEIPWTEEPPGLQSMWLQRVRHDLVIKKNKNQQNIHMQMITAFSPRHWWQTRQCFKEFMDVEMNK